MVKCFWEEECDCPEKTPNGNACTEHTAYRCSIFNGQVVTTELQIEDVNTRIMERVIDELARDLSEFDTINDALNQIKANMEAHKSWAQQKRQHLQSLATAGSSLSDTEKDQLKQRMREIAEGIEATLDNQIQQLGNDIETLKNHHLDMIPWARRLIGPFPYDAPHATNCTCYDIKKHELLFWSEIIEDERLNLRDLLIEYRAIQSGIQDNAIALIIMLVAFFIFLWFGLVPLALSLLLFMLIAFVLIIVKMMQLNAKSKEISEKKEELIWLMLTYYRLKMIPHCLNSLKRKKPIDGYGGHGEDKHGALRERYSQEFLSKLDKLAKRPQRRQQKMVLKTKRNTKRKKSS